MCGECGADRATFEERDEHGAGDPREAEGGGGLHLPDSRGGKGDDVDAGRSDAGDVVAYACLRVVDAFAACFLSASAVVVAARPVGAFTVRALDTVTVPLVA